MSCEQKKRTEKANQLKVKVKVKIKMKAKIFSAPQAMAVCFFCSFCSFSLISAIALYYSSAVSAQTRVDDGQNQEKGIVGLNYAIGANGYPIIVDVYKNSPADRAGLKKGSEIYAVNNQDARYIGYLQLQAQLSGKTGTPVAIKAAGKNYRLLRVSRSSFKDPQLQDNAGRASTYEAGANLTDLPFAMLSREHNKPTLFEFVAGTGLDPKNTPSISARLKAHRDGNYILSQTRIIRIDGTDREQKALRRYLQISSPYALVPVYAPWLVTVKSADILKAPPNQEQLDRIARTLMHNAMKVGISHTVAAQNGAGAVDQKLNKRHGLAHKAVLKRICQAMPAGTTIAGLGFGAGPDGHAVITEVFKNGAGEKAGLKPGDEIRSIDGVDTRYLGLEHIQAALVGPAGAQIKLAIGKNQAKIMSDDSDTQRLVTVKFLPASDKLAKITLAVWKREYSTDPDDSDEYELPCCLVGKAQARPTIFEFRQSAPPPTKESAAQSSAPTLQNQLEQLRSREGHNHTTSGGVDWTDLQIVTYTPADHDYEKLRQYFRIKTDYACLPIYSRSRHKTIKRDQIITASPNEAQARHLFDND